MTRFYPPRPAPTEPLVADSPRPSPDREPRSAPADHPNTDSSTYPREQEPCTDTETNMNRKRARRYGLFAVVVAVGILVLYLVVSHAGLLPVSTGSYEQRTLTVTDCAGDERATVTADVATSSAQQYVGLSRTDSLAPDEGMLFPYDGVASREFEMRNMAFGLDIVYIGSNGEITEITTMDAPGGPLEYYLTYDSTTGVGQYVLEVVSGWSEANGVSSGDCVTGLP